MNPIKLFAGAVIFGGLISASTYAADAACGAQCKAGLSAVPQPYTVVNPEALPRRFAGTTVKLAFTIDEHGQPHDITVVKPTDRDLARSLVPALAQWRFTPAQENGVAVAKRVILPLTLSAGS